MSDQRITPDLLLQAYSAGIFPMAESSDSADLFWVDPDDRGIFPLDQFHISRSTKRAMRQLRPNARVNDDFIGVMRACADRKDTWINDQIYKLYGALHRAGYAHSIAIYHDNQLIGGVYGVALGGAFFGESMFSKQTNGSKIALSYLIARLRVGGFTLFDTQFLTPHLASLGAIEIPRSEFHNLLKPALATPADFGRLPYDASVEEVIHLSTQTS